MQQKQQLKSTPAEGRRDDGCAAAKALTDEQSELPLPKTEVAQTVFSRDDKLLGRLRGKEPQLKEEHVRGEGSENSVEGENQAINGIHLNFELDHDGAPGNHQETHLFPSSLDPSLHPVITSEDEVAQETTRCIMDSDADHKDNFDSLFQDEDTLTSASVIQTSKFHLLSDDDAPEWTVRPHIKTGYRNEMSWGQCVASLFILHNEAGNVWTHLVGFFVYLYLFIWEIVRNDKTPAHTACSVAFLVASLICMALSVNFHLLAPHSKDMYETTLKFDLTGVGINISSSLVVGLVYGFWCHPFLGNIYLSIVGVLSFVALLWPHNPQLMTNFNLTVAFFSTYTAFALVPLIHWVVVVGGFASEEARIFFWRCIMIFVLYGMGFAAYALQMPEKLYPGTFDNFLHSHQIWHLFVLGGGLMCYYIIQIYASFREANACP